MSLFETPVRYVDVGEALAAAKGAWAMVDANVLRLYGGRIEAEHVLRIPSGERSKGQAGLQRAWRWLAATGAGRGATVAAIGGGVVGDLAGFAAATFCRGVRLIHVPTTLLAMVDSAHGGKTGIDLPEGKNLVGSFYAASETVVATGFLATLKSREFRSGAAEVWKYGAIARPGLLARLEESPLRPDDPSLVEIVQECAEAKLEIVRRDPSEQTGVRAALNFGHTVGHAVEAEAGYGRIRHGEAVAIGMVVESRLAERTELAAPGLAERLERGLRRQGLPTRVPPGLDPGRLVERMGRDKKRTGRLLAFSLVTEPGRCTLVTDVEPGDVFEALQAG